MALQQQIFGFNTEYNFHEQNKGLKKGNKYHEYDSNRPLTNSQIKRIKPKISSKNGSVKKNSIMYSSKKRKAKSKNDHNLKTSKWVKQSNKKTKYEQWKLSKKERVQRKHQRKHSEQIFSTLTQNQNINPMLTSRSRAKQRVKTRKKLSIDINKNLLDHSNLAYKRYLKSYHTNHL